MKTLFLALSLVSVNAFAWGPTGHRVVGEVAQKYLDSKVAVKINKLLKGHDLAKVSTWADEIRSEPQTYSHTFNWHYTEWPDEIEEHSEHENSGQLITSINTQLRVLGSPDESEEKKAFALKFLVHLVGDLHMPLHVGNGLDRGGNLCKVTFHGKATNLHSLWDEGLIEFSKLSFKELAKFVSAGRGHEEIQAWKEGALVDWAQESKAIRSSIYPENVIPASKMSTKSYCRQDVKPEEIPKLSFEYSYKFFPVVEKRLFQGGLRLATLLNKALK